MSPRSSAPPQQIHLQFFQNRPLAFSLMLAMAVVAPEAPLWITLFSALLLGYKFYVEKVQTAPLSRRLTALLSVAIFIEVMVQYRSLFVQEASTTLLVGLTALKVMDYENDRDLKFLFLLGFILVSLKPLYNIDFYWMLPTMACFVGLWWSLLNSLPQKLIASKPRFLGRIFVSALPLTAVLFVVFPRIVVPWAQSKAQSQSQMGFSDELNPGQVAELVSTKSLVFRARFFDNLELKSRALYWRGAVLHQSKGLQWHVGRTQFHENTLPELTNAIRYEVLLEPSGQEYFFGLDKTLSLESSGLRLRRTDEAVFKTSAGLNRPLSYEGQSSPMGHHQDPPTEQDLAIPVLEEKSKKWVDRVTSTFSNSDLRLKELQRFFSDGSFAYSLKPGSYSENGMDQFLFQKRRGFCEHFAGAYATLARALGVPSRVITGFQGGVYNSYGGFWRVTTHDAHAWVEIFQQGQWERVDPTEWVAPLRLEIGAEAFFELPEEEQRSWAPGQYQSHKEQGWERWLNFASNQLEFMNYQWTQFLLDYDRGTQSHFLTLLKENWGWAFIGFVILMITLGLVLKALEPKPKGPAPLSQLYVDLIAWGNAHGLTLNPGETPLEFSQRFGARFPHFKVYLNDLGTTYERALYQGLPVLAREVRVLRGHWRQVRKLEPDSV